MPSIDEQIEQLKKQITENPKDSLAHYNLGCALLYRTQQREDYGNEESDLERAEENFRKALEFDPNFSSAQRNLEAVRRMIEYGWIVHDESGSIIKFFAGRSD